MRRLVLLAVVAGCAEEAPLDDERVVTVAPGELAELNTILEAGGTALVEFSAAAAMTWDVHRHIGDDAIFVLDEGVASSGRLPLTPDEEGRYSWLWQNLASDPIELTVGWSLPDGAIFHSFETAPIP